MAEIKFQFDTKHRKQWFTGISFSHPAKMSLPLQLWLIENFTKEGETILDPMAGSGTVLVTCSMGRNVICVELEEKFVDMMTGNWEKIQQRGPQMGYQMGKATILQGDARNLTGILADKIITSPTYGNPRNTSEEYDDKYDLRRPKGVAWGRESFRGRYGNTDGQVGNLPYGQVEKIISSPPYEKGLDASGAKSAEGAVSIGDIQSVCKELGIKHASENIKAFRQKMLERKRQYTDKVDAVISSPPYEGTVQPSKSLSERTDKTAEFLKSDRPNTFEKSGSGLLLKGYSTNDTNIGNLKSASYLEAMLAVYQQCFAVLKPGGLMLLVTKNFIRNKAIVRLDLDTIRLCEQAGFTFVERHCRKLTAQSFWRVIQLTKCDYRRGGRNNPKCRLGLVCPIKIELQMAIAFALQKKDDNITKAMEIVERLCPSFKNTVPKLDTEDILVFSK